VLSRYSTVLPIVCELNRLCLPDIVEIDRNSSVVPWASSHFEAEFDLERSTILGARANGVLVGFLIFHIILDEAHIVNLAVAPEFQRKGVGTALMTEAIDRIVESGARWITLEVRVSNQAARGLYTSFGFRQVGLRPRYYSDNSEDAVLMTLDSHLP
jgi:[ribosomal protein S18]-alanine N-acetyltransferase